MTAGKLWRGVKTRFDRTMGQPPKSVPLATELRNLYSEWIPQGCLCTWKFEDVAGDLLPVLSTVSFIFIFHGQHRTQSSIGGKEKGNREGSVLCWIYKTFSFSLWAYFKTIYLFTRSRVESGAETGNCNCWEGGALDPGLRVTEEHEIQF